MSNLWTPTRSGEDTDLEHVNKISSPLRLGQTLWEAGELFNPRIKFRADPWLLMSELAIMDAVVDFDHERFLKINAPPQCTKSTLLEVLTPMWILGHYPDTRIILIAYSDDLAVKNGAKVRDLFMALGPQLFGLTVDPKYESKQEWKIHGHDGGMLSVGIGSKITGQPGDIILIGDVIKTMQEAGSEAVKKNHWDEFNGAIMSRIGPGATILLAATRFAEDDLSGRIDEMMADPEYDGDHWQSLVFKAIAEPTYDDPAGDDEDWTDLLGRVRGEPLQTRYYKPGDELPENWYGSHFYRRKRALTQAGQTFTFSCLYQGEPTAPEGGMFPDDKWGWFDPEDRPRLVVMRNSWDLAASEGTGDWSTGGIVGRSAEGKVLICDLVRFQKDPNAVLTEVRANAQVNGAGVPILIEEERNGAGKTVIAFYKKELAGFTVKASPADGTKEDRARPYSTLQKRGDCLLPRYADGTSPPWVKGFIAEHRKMMGDGRRGRHDDMIDVVAHAVNDMIGAGAMQLLDPNIRRNHRTGRVMDASLEDEESEDYVGV